MQLPFNHKQLCLGAALWSLLSFEQARGDESPKLQTERDRINYSVGYQIGGDFKRQQVELASDPLVKGIQDAMSDSEPLIPRDEMRMTLVELKKKILTQQENPRRVAIEGYRGEGREFLAENAKKPGVVVLPSGLQYKVLLEGTGRSPTPADEVTVNYRGTLIDGSEFDSSPRRKEPGTFPLTGVIPGWREALPLMKEGSKWQLFIPADLAFGERGPLADRVVIYEIELVSVSGPPQKD